jgi:tight adherence protein C
LGLIRHVRRAPGRVRALRARESADRAPLRASLSPRARRLLVGVGGVAAFVLAPPLGVAVVAACLAAPRLRARAAVKRARAAVEADLPEVVDLLRLAVGAGLTVPLAVAAVGRRAEGPVGRALADAAAATAVRGARLADALDGLPDSLGEPVRALASTLAGSERYGHAIGPALERLAAEGRADQRRRAEAAARRVPVLLLFPLVLCILPAFALLTVAPLLVSGLRSLHLG